MEDDIKYQKSYGPCDYCGRMTRLTIQYLNGEPVNAWCKKCKPEEQHDDS